MRLALFDLDNTLLTGDSDYEWGQFLVDHGVLDRDAYEAQNRVYYEQYVAGTLDIHEYLGFALRPLAEHAAADLERWHGEFMRLRIQPMITPAARDLVARHRDAGDLCAVITATNSFVTAPIAREFGVPHLIATEPEQRDGRFTGRVAGTPCFREGKILRLENWLADAGHRLPDFAESVFYSDSHNDLPLLERVTRPVAVDPDEALGAEAARRGWAVMSLRR
ncbi:MAG TPA: HAD family hydrolase [Burkholderiales bacterium]